MWSKLYLSCIKCNTTDIVHEAHGLCKNCYNKVMGKKWYKKYRDNHPDRKREQNRKYYYSNREREKKRITAWREANHEKVKIAGRLRKARQRNISPETNELRLNKKKLHAIGKCQKCNSDEKLEIHHKIPRNKGGSHSLNNMILLCHKCHCVEHGHNID
jgi:5-methylcytosine-specific restriction endonuclease McrA